MSQVSINRIRYKAITHALLIKKLYIKTSKQEKSEEFDGEGSSGVGIFLSSKLRFNRARELLKKYQARGAFFSDKSIKSFEFINYNTIKNRLTIFKFLETDVDKQSFDEIKNIKDFIKKIAGNLYHNSKINRGKYIDKIINNPNPTTYFLGFKVNGEIDLHATSLSIIKEGGKLHLVYIDRGGILNLDKFFDKKSYVFTFDLSNKTDVIKLKQFLNSIYNIKLYAGFNISNNNILLYIFYKIFKLINQILKFIFNNIIKNLLRIKILFSDQKIANYLKDIYEYYNQNLTSLFNLSSQKVGNCCEANTLISWRLAIIEQYIQENKVDFKTAYLATKSIFKVFYKLDLITNYIDFLKDDKICIEENLEIFFNITLFLTKKIKDDPELKKIFIQELKDNIVLDKYKQLWKESRSKYSKKQNEFYKEFAKQYSMAKDKGYGKCSFSTLLINNDLQQTVTTFTKKETLFFTSPKSKGIDKIKSLMSNYKKLSQKTDDIIDRYAAGASRSFKL